MSRARVADRTAWTREVLRRLKKAYPGANCALEHRTPFELLVATILSAQCTDVRVNMVTPALFAKYPTPRSLAEADQADIEELIRSTGFFRNKAKNLIGLAQGLVERFGGQVPRTMDELLTLPGVARKTANCVLSNAFGLAEGVVVDTHVLRLARLLGLTRSAAPARVEEDLCRRFPREAWALLSHLLIWHGRRTCIANRPRCGECALAPRCPGARVPASSSS